jgi:hypothetical protein
MSDDELTEVMLDYAQEDTMLPEIDWSTGKKIRPRG